MTPKVESMDPKRERERENKRRERGCAGRRAQPAGGRVALLELYLLLTPSPTQLAPARLSRILFFKRWVKVARGELRRLPPCRPLFTFPCALST
eukprot:scaffold174518_cov31-Tisochrysis_lutea.AAC.1